MMDYYFEAPPAPPVLSAALAPFNPKSKELDTFFDRIEDRRSRLRDLFEPAKGALAPTGKTSQQPYIVDAHTTPVAERLVQSSAPEKQLKADEIRSVASQRVRLLAAKYAAGPDKNELLARLEILNQRLIDKAPRVVASQVDALESAQTKLMELSAARAARHQLLGL